MICSQAELTQIVCLYASCIFCACVCIGVSLVLVLMCVCVCVCVTQAASVSPALTYGVPLIVECKAASLDTGLVHDSNMGVQPQAVFAAMCEVCAKGMLNSNAEVKAHVLAIYMHTGHGLGA